MSVLDTNVLSAVMGERPVPAVAAWVAAQPEEQLFTTSVCQAEKCAERYAELFAARRRAGKPTATTDLMIGSIAAREAQR